MSYDSLYRVFDSAALRRYRRDAYGEDIGQHSWVSADELRADLPRLALTPTSRLLDLGCGPCGPLTFLVATVGCSGTGLEGNAAALEVGRSRAREMGIDSRLTLQEANLDRELPLAPRSFDAAVCHDVVLHLRDRVAFFREVARVLRPGGRFLLTDAGLITGPVSSQEMRRRSPHGSTHFVPAGRNETLLAAAGWRVIESEDRTAGLARTAAARLTALGPHRESLESAWGTKAFQEQRDYLEVVLEMARRRAMSRFMIAAEAL